MPIADARHCRSCSLFYDILSPIRENVMEPMATIALARCPGSLAFSAAGPGSSGARAWAQLPCHPARPEMNAMRDDSALGSPGLTAQRLRSSSGILNQSSGT